MINLSNWAVDNKKLVYFLIIMLCVGGIMSYWNMSKLEDPEIKVKQATVVTMYPGASSHEVELEVTDPLEKSIRSLSVVNEVTSESMNDVSVLTVTLSTLLSNKEVEQGWDLLRRKVSDTQSSLPKGAMQSVVLDGYGDVFGMFYALTFDDYSNEEAIRYAELLSRELQKIEGISQVNIFGKQHPCINIDLYEDKMASLGVHPALVLNMLQGQNETIYSGYYETGGQRLRLTISDRNQTVADIENMVLQGSEGDQLRLGDIAHVSESYEHPTRTGMRYDGKEAIGISISADSGTDITQIGKEVEKRLKQLQQQRLPAGMELNKVFFQPQRVSDALNNFILNLIESVVIVVLILVFFMGIRSGLILGLSLLVTVLGSIALLQIFDGTLQRVSLASFILAMGMLVDNAIVILDGIQIDLERGVSRPQALTEAGRKTAMALLGATLIAILSFLPIFLSPDTTGIYVRDLFIVLAVSLLLSWVLALVMIPVVADASLHPQKKVKESDLYSGRIYRWLAASIRWVLRHKKTTLSVGITAIVASGLAYRLLPQGFFPDMDYDQLYIEYRLPEGYTTTRVNEDLTEIEHYLQGRPEVTHVTTAIGATPSRYNLVRSITGSSLSYGELIVDFKSSKSALKHIDELQSYLSAQYPDAQVRVKRYNLMFKEYPIEVIFKGPDPAILHKLTDSVVDIMQQQPETQMARSNWFPKVPALHIQYDQANALRAGLTRRDIGLSLMGTTYGIPVGTFYEGAERKSINIRSVDKDGMPIESLEQAAIFGTTPSLSAINKETIQGLMTGTITKQDVISMLLRTVPLSGVSEGIDLVWEEPIIRRINGERSMKAQCSPNNGESAEALRTAIAKEVEQIELPEGYSMEWGGEYSASHESTKYLFRYYPVAVILMLAILIMLFGDYRKPLIVILCLPPLAIGVVWGMLISGKTFGFTAIVATLGLIGMLIKNIIVLLDEITLLISQGVRPHIALIESSKSRLRPVMLASLTTILGMLPLLGDELFGPAAVVIMGGLLVGTLVTLLFVPLLYAIFYGIHKPKTISNE
ncbi:efflux RND transporter permease subunit [Porphyromonas loveana]|uniref:efflux RND transporter permease subunit n=2 Tax=Porphyromonas loveana TaxID=1884669 RepID=UPI0035A07DC5